MAAANQIEEDKSLRLQINFLTKLINKHKQNESTKVQKQYKYVNPLATRNIKKTPAFLKTSQFKFGLSTDIKMHPFRGSTPVLNPYSFKLSKKQPMDQKKIPTHKEKELKHTNKLSKNPYSLVNPHCEVLQRNSPSCKDVHVKTALVNSEKFSLNIQSCTTTPSVTSGIACQVTKALPLKRLNRYKLIKTDLLSSKKIHSPPVLRTQTVLQPKSTSSQINKVKIGRFFVCQSTCTSPQLVKLSRHHMVRMNMPSKVTRKVNRYKLEQKITALPLYTNANKLSNNLNLRKKSKSDFVFKRSWSSSQSLSSPMPVIFRSKYAISRMFKKKTPVKKPTTLLKRNDKMIVIGGLMYKCSRNKLSRANQAATNNKHSQLIVKNWNPKKARIIKVRGIKFEVDPSGHHLQKICPTSSYNKNKNVSMSSPNLSRVDLGGITYVQQQSGLFVKSYATYTRSLASRVLHRSINRVQTAKLRKDNKQQYCMFFNRFGKCNKQNICPYIHDPDKIAVCTRFLRGTCHLENCPFSHKISKEKMPVCSFFLRGICSKDDCPYLHSNVGPNADVCKDFLKGYCALGEKCKKRHVLTCEEFEKTGKCKHGEKCPLAFQRNKANKRKTTVISSSAVPETPLTSVRNIGVEDIAAEDVESKRLKKQPSFISLADVSISELNSPITSNSEEPEKILKIRPQFLKL